MHDAEASDLDLISMIYDAALDGSAWPQVFAGLSKRFADANGLLYAYDSASNATPLALPFGTDEQFTNSYLAHFAPINPYPANSFAMPKFAAGMVGEAREVVAPDDVRRGEFYNDWMKPQGIGPQHFGIVLAKSPGSIGILAIAPNEAYLTGRYDDVKRQLERLAPHVVRSFEFARQTGPQGQVGAILSDSLDMMGIAAFVVQPTGKVIHANGRAEAMLASRDPLFLRSDRSLGARDVAVENAIQGTIAAAARDGCRIGPPVRMTSNEGKTNQWAWALPAKKAFNINAAHWITRLDSMIRGEALLLLVTNGDRRGQVSESLLRAAFGLTVAEARLVAALLAGESLASFAKRTGHSRNTLRNQMAVIFDKTGTRRQAELVVKILAAIGPFARA